MKALLLLQLIGCYLRFALLRLCIKNTLQLYKYTMASHAQPLNPSQKRYISRLYRTMHWAQKRLGITFNCWTLSLALQHLLSKKEIIAYIQVGFKKGTSQVLGHAWVQIDLQDSSIVFNTDRGFHPLF